MPTLDVFIDEKHFLFDNDFKEFILKELINEVDY